MALSFSWRALEASAAILQLARSASRPSVWAAAKATRLCGEESSAKPDRVRLACIPKRGGEPFGE